MTQNVLCVVSEGVDELITRTIQNDNAWELKRRCQVHRKVQSKVVLHVVGVADIHDCLPLVSLVG